MSDLLKLPRGENALMQAYRQQRANSSNRITQSDQIASLYKSIGAIAPIDSTAPIGEIFSATNPYVRTEISSSTSRS